MTPAATERPCANDRVALTSTAEAIGAASELLLGTNLRRER